MAKCRIRNRRLHPAGPSAGQSSLAGVLAGALGLLIASAALALAVNHFSRRGIPLLPKAGRGDQAEAKLPLPPGVRAMTREQAYAAFVGRSALFLDGRTPEEYAEGHIPGALNLPADEFESHFLDISEQVEAAPALITYCLSLECGEGVEIAERLREIVSQPIYVYERGWEAWKEAGYPGGKGEQP